MRAYAAGLVLAGESGPSLPLRRLEADRTHLLRLVENADKASKAMNIKRGAKSRRSVNLLVDALCHIFEAETKRPVTHTRATDGTPSSPAGRFIVAAVKAIDNAITATQISTALAQFMANRDSASRRGQANN